MRLLLSATIFIAGFLLVSVAGQLNTAYQWKYIDYLWTSEAQRQNAISSGAYNYANIIPMDVDVSQEGRVFISMLGSVGVPARLGTVTNNIGPSGPLIQPYPNWGWHDSNNCNSILDVYRITIDKCNRLWIADAGLTEGLARKCKAKLLAFDLNTDRLITRVVIPDNIATNSKNGQTLLANVKVETYGPYCSNTTVYIGDANGNGLIIWDDSRLFRLESSVFEPQPGEATIQENSILADIPAGIVGMDISPRLFPNEPRFLYFRPLASYGMFAADTESLKRSKFGESVKFQGARRVLSSQTVGHAFSSRGTLFMGLTKETAIACWNHYRDLRSDNIIIVAQDSQRLRYANNFKVIQPSASIPEEELWVLTNQFVTFESRRLNFNNWNFFVLRGSVDRLIAGSKCEMPRETALALQQVNQGNPPIIN